MQGKKTGMHLRTVSGVEPKLEPAALSSAESSPEAGTACRRCLSRRPSPWMMYRSSAGLLLSALPLLGWRRGSSAAAMQSAPAHHPDITSDLSYGAQLPELGRDGYMLQMLMTTIK